MLELSEFCKFEVKEILDADILEIETSKKYVLLFKKESNSLPLFQKFILDKNYLSMNEENKEKPINVLFKRHNDDLSAVQFYICCDNETSCVETKINHFLLEYERFEYEIRHFSDKDIKTMIKEENTGLKLFVENKINKVIHAEVCFCNFKLDSDTLDKVDYRTGLKFDVENNTLKDLISFQHYILNRDSLVKDIFDKNKTEFYFKTPEIVNLNEFTIAVVHKNQEALLDMVLDYQKYLFYHK